ncbi:hypothetical protein AVEN_187809-1 [Araneus ventricosus]|uniref:Uncharacterized protein n=1 Tax=Araneus ventricosus TaxID=182803 RepID=A0A4Y2H1T1_ARAVE|nr:hypothetical protein AVEN_187809-1 [Araneus ventricosus]
MYHARMEKSVIQIRRAWNPSHKCGHIRKSLVYVHHNTLLDYISWTFTVRPLQNLSSMGKSDENWHATVEKSEFSSSFVIHLQCRVIKPKCDRGERDSHKSESHKM